MSEDDKQQPQPHKQDASANDAVGPAEHTDQLEGELGAEALVEETRTELQLALDKRAYELAVMGWLKVDAGHQAISMLQSRDDWSDEVKQEVRKYAEMYYHERDFSQFVGLYGCIGEDPMPRVTQYITERLDEGDYESASSAWSCVHNSHIHGHDQYRMPDENLLNCARICLVNKNDEHAVDCFSHMQTMPDRAEVERIITLAIDNNWLEIAIDLCKRWSIDSFKGRFVEVGKSKLDDNDIYSAIDPLEAGDFDFKVESQIREQLLRIARSNLERIKEWELGFFSGDDFVAMKKWQDYHGAQRAIKLAGDTDDMIALAVDALAIERGELERRDVFRFMFQRGEKLNEVIALLRGVPIQHEGVKQRLLECGEVLVRDAVQNSRVHWTDIRANQEERDKETEEKLRKAKEIYELEGVNPTAVHIAELARAHFVLGNEKTASELVEAYGEPVRAQLIDDPKNTPMAMYDLAGKQEERFKLIRKRISSGGFAQVMHDCFKYLSADEIDAVRPNIRTRAKRELKRLFSKMKEARNKKIADEKSRWGDGQAHKKWNEAIERVLDVYRKLEEPVPDEQAQILQQLALLVQYAYVDTSGWSKVDYSWNSDSKNTVQQMYECLAQQEMGTDDTTAQGQT